MHIIVVGMNHKSASVDLRERVNFSGEALEHVLTQLHGTRTVLESVVLSTCNRTEIYALVSSVRAGHDFFLTLFAQRAGMNKEEMALHTYVLQGEEAAAHAMRVASGLDSVVIGETQILGQMRDAFTAAFEAGNTGAMFNRLFREVLHVGKRAQAQTTVGQNAVSVSYAAVQLASKVVGGLANKTALVIGAGQMATLAARHLVAQGIGRLIVANRTVEKALERLGDVAEVVSISDISNVIRDADVVFSATGATGYTITGVMAQAALAHRKSRPIAMLDMAVPRDIDPAIAQLPTTYVYDVDDLAGVIDANVKERERQAAVIEEMIAEGVQSFSNWLTEQEVVPLIVALREKGEAIQREVMQSLVRKLPDLSDHDRKIINKHTMSIVNQLLRDPIQNVKELAMASGDTAYATMFANLFGIELSHERAEQTSLNGFSASAVAELFSRLLGEQGEGKRPLHPVLR